MTKEPHDDDGEAPASDADADTGGDGDEGAGSDELATSSDVPFVVPKPYTEGKSTPYLVAAALTVLLAVAFHFSLSSIQPGLTPLVAIGGLYAVFAGLAVLRFKQKHDLELFRPKGGDITIATFVAALLYGVGYAGVTFIMPRGSVHEGWIFRVYLVLGGAFGENRHYLGVGLLLIGALEEVSWRGLVLDGLEGKLGRLKAALVTSALWAVAHAPTLYRLGDPTAGPNPLLVVAAFGCGVVWSYLRYRTDRLAPAVISHAIFSWAIVEFPLLH